MAQRFKVNLRKIRGVQPKTVIRGLYDSSFGKPIRSVHFRNAVQREGKTTRLIAECLGYRTSAETLRLKLADHSSKTCFILGSGSSVSELTEAAFDRIRAGFSVGINSWVSHPFNADAYSFEADGLMSGDTSEISAMSQDLSLKASTLPELSIFLLRPKRVDLAHRMVQVPTELRDSTYMYGRQNLLSARDKNLESDIRFGLEATMKQFQETNVVIDNGASAVRLLALSAILGFKRIVLVGIDLNFNPYFWFDGNNSGVHKRLRSIYRRPSGVVHGTQNRTERPFATDRFLSVMSLHLKDKLGVTVYAGSKNSALAGRLPVFQW